MARDGTANGRPLRLATISYDSANSHYRAIVPLQELARRGHTVHWPGDPTFEALEGGRSPSWDALHVQQIFGPEAIELIGRLRRDRVAVVWDTDDDISAVPRGTEAWRRLGGRRSIKRHFEESVAAAKAVHLMTTPSEHLANRYREAGVEHVLAVENYLAPQDLAHPRRAHRGVVIGITAANEHGDDVRKLKLAPALERLLARHDGVRVVAVGVDLGLRDPRYAHVAGVEIGELIPVECGFDVALAPLRDTGFNRARSNVKLKEYGAAGAMWLASPVGPYVGMGEEQGGLLVDDGDWLATLEALLEDPDRRRALAARARRWAEGQTIAAGAAQWQAAFHDAVQRAREG